MKSFLLIAAIIGLPVAESDVVPFKEQCLKIHNYYRKIHQVGPVTWSDRMERVAKEWANYLADNNLFKHSSDHPGNLYMTRGYRPTEYCTAAIKAMYENEEKLYDYSKPGYQKRAGHFTMIVWKRTKFIGAAWAERKDGRFLVVIKYAPIGNFASAKAFKANVFPPLPTTAAPTAVIAAGANWKPPIVSVFGISFLVIIFSFLARV